MIDQKSLKNVLEYDPDTGLFRWIVRYNARMKKGWFDGAVNGHGYMVIMIDKRLYTAHRLAWLYVYGYFPRAMVDHINMNKTDNRIVNLREATNQQNMQNRGKPANNRSGFKGIYLDKRTGKYQAKITANGNVMYLGAYDKPEDGHAAYVAAALEVHGEFAKA